MTIEFDDKGKIYTDVIRKVPTAVIIQTGVFRIHGNIYLRPGERIKDALNVPEPFLAVTDASVYDQDGELIQESGFLALNQEHILWVIPRRNTENGSSEWGEQ